jgi:Acetyl-coenzyme A synthetase N-terminus
MALFPARLLEMKPMTDYAETYRRSIEQPEQFWAEAAEAIDWARR